MQSSDVPGFVAELADALSRVLRVDTEVFKRRDDEPLYEGMYTIMLVDGSGVLTPQLSIGKVSIEVKADDKPRPTGFVGVVLRINDKLVADKLVLLENCYNRATGSISVDCVARGVAEVIQFDRFSPRLLKTLDTVVSVLKDSGFNPRLKYSHTLGYLLYARKKGLAVKVRIDKNDVAVYVTVLTPAVDCVDPGAWEDAVRGKVAASGNRDLYSYFTITTYVGNKKKDMDTGAVEVGFHEVRVDKIPLLIQLVVETVRDMENAVKKLLEKVKPVDAMAVELLARLNHNLYDILREQKGVIKWRAREYYKMAVGEDLPDELGGYRLAEILYMSGRLIIDELWHLRLVDAEGCESVSDMVAKFTGSRVVVSKAHGVVDLDAIESRIVGHLLATFGFDVKQMIMNMELITDRVVYAVVLNDKLSEKYSDVFAESQDIWSRMTLSAKVKLLEHRQDIINKARSKGWTWVLKDPRPLAVALVRSLPEDVKFNPSLLTKTLLEHVPEFFGSRYSVLYAGGEPFVKIGNVVLQVIDVSEVVVVVRGTVGTSRVGMVAIGEDVVSAARAINENIVDAVLELKDVVRAIESGRLKNVKLDERQTPLFTIPVLIVDNGKTQHELPLHHRLKRTLKNYGVEIEDVEEEKAVA